jgi:hypothetical protein
VPDQTHHQLKRVIVASPRVMHGWIGTEIGILGGLKVKAWVFNKCADI